jgi:chromosome segregation ATPase
MNGDAPDVHQPGSIVRIKVKNFVTYTAAEFKCRPSLNMIIGPNGTGKSTIVCAICLGLGFPPLCLGRAKEIGEYVKHGHREAEIEIELAAGPRQKGKNPIIRCAIKREGSKTSWYINGSSTTRKEVRQLVESFHIQIDNLCQFLPQDRVVEFSRLTPIELLDSTQKAVAPDHMAEWHNELKGLGKERIKLLQDQNSSKEHLSQLQTRQNQQRADVERMTERKALLDKVKVLEKGRPGLRYQAERAKHREMRSRNQEAKDEMKDLEKEVEPALRRLRDKEKYGEDLDRLLHHRKGMVNRFENNILTIQTKLEEHKTKLADCDKQIEEERKSEQENKQERKRVEQIISRFRNRLESEPTEFNPSDYNERIREKDRELRNLTPQYQDLQDQKAHLKNKVKAENNELDDAKKQLKNLQSEAGQQLNRLQQFSKETASAWEWIQHNQALFKDKVYGPPIIECAVKDSRYADAIETLLQKDDLIALTVTNVEDFRTLEDNLRGKQHLKDIVVRSVTRGLDHFKPPLPREALVEYSLDYWVIDLLAGPDPVLTMLCDNPRLHRNAVTLKQHNDTQYEKLSSESSPISTWIADRQAYRINRRREYGSQASSTMVSQVRSARFWSKQSTDSAVERDLRQKIAEKTGELEEMERQYRQLQAEDKELQDSKKKIEEERVSFNWQT